MAHKEEPAWLAAIFIALGFFVIAGALGLLYLFVTYWPVFVGLAGAGGVFYWFTWSPWALERDAREQTHVLLRELKRLDVDFPTAQEFSQGILETIFAQHDRSALPSYSVLVNILGVAEALYEDEGFSLSAVGEPPRILDSIEGARYREFLIRQHAKLADRAAFDAVRRTLTEALSEFARALPAAARHDTEELDAAIAAHQAEEPESLLSIPVIDLLPGVGQRVQDLILPFYSEQARSLGVFARLREQLDRNLCEVSELPFTHDNRTSPRLIMPTKHEGPAADIVDGYLAHTPLLDLFQSSIPIRIPLKLRFEHTHILAGSGHGKTQTLQHLILSDLTHEQPPSLVIIDSQGDMLRKISRLALFDPDEGALASKLIVINPADVDYPPALNMFDVNFERLGQYNQAAREQILNGVIELYDYIFGSLLGAELTQKQSVIFRYLARLMLTIPGATIHDLLHLLSDVTPYARNIAELPPGARMFFETEFPHKSFVDTKRQIQRRLWGILENPTFERMLSAPENRVDMFDALNSGKIVLVNTAKDFLKAERSSFLGRFFIALTLQAALERAALPESARHPAFLYIDEAADYFDRNIDDLLTQARKYNLGVIFSHQYLDQLAPGLRSSIASNTSIKLAGGVSDRDARSMAPDMRTTPTFILEQTKEAQATRFACYLRNVTPHALSLSVPLGRLERQPVMSDNAYCVMEAINRSSISVQDDAQPRWTRPEDPRSHIAIDPMQASAEPSSQSASAEEARTADPDDWSS